MMNQVMIVGRIRDVISSDNRIVIKVRRQDDSEDVIITPKILDDMWNSIQDYVNTDDVVGVRGHLDVIEDQLEVIVDKLTFLSRVNK